MRHFVNDDVGYLDWLGKNPAGFVVNTYTRPSVSYLKLHRASCPTNSKLQRGAKTFTNGEYSKVCGTHEEIEQYVRRLGGSADSCPICL